MLKGLQIVEGGTFDPHGEVAAERAPQTGPRRGAELVTDPARLRRAPCGAAGATEDASAERQSRIDMAFFPLRGYHVDDCLPVVEGLRRAGLEVVVVETDGWRDGGGEVARSAARHGLRLMRLEDFLSRPRSVRCAVLWNDWDLLMRLVAKACHEAGTETIAWVEGIQDYHDVDRGRGLMRFPYLRSRHVILPGPFDARYFDETGQILHRGEIVRVNALWPQRRQQAPAAERPRALINSNFSYGVMEEHRDTWVTEAVTACLAAGFEPVISRHPFDMGRLYPQYTTTRPFSDVARDCAVTIQRFASGILESLALGVPVIYFNAHGERIDKFKSPENAYLLADTRDGLEGILAQRLYFWEEGAARGFLRLHAGLGDEDTTPGDRIMAVLLSILRRTPEPAEALCDCLGEVPERGAFEALRDRIIDIGPFYGAEARQPILRGRAPAIAAHAPALPETPGGDGRASAAFRFFLFGDAEGAAAWVFHEPAQARRHVEARGRGLVLYDDPVSMLEATLEVGGDTAAMLAQWERNADRALELLRHAGAQLAVIERGGLVHAPSLWEPLLAEVLDGRSLPEELRPSGAVPDPLLVLAAEQIMQGAPAAQQRRAELQAHVQRLGAAPVPPRADIAAALKQYHAMRGACATLKTEITRIHRARDHLDDRVRVAIPAAEKAKAKALRRVEELEAELATARNRNAELEAELATERNRTAELAGELSQVYSSKSWRVTGPLRGARRRMTRDP